MATDNLFVAYCQKMRDAVDAALMGAFAFPLEDDIQALLYRPLENFIASGGKRARPILLCLAAQAYGANPHEALQVAASLEYFQAAALIHDDIADESETRRGVPCLHRSEGDGLAINAGDLSLVESFACVADDTRVPAACRHAVMVELCEMMMRTVEGQALDLGWARDGRWDVTCEDYLAMATPVSYTHLTLPTT